MFLPLNLTSSDILLGLREVTTAIWLQVDYWLGVNNGTVSKPPGMLLLIPARA